MIGRIGDKLTVWRYDTLAARKSRIAFVKPIGILVNPLGQCFVLDGCESFSRLFEEPPAAEHIIVLGLQKSSSIAIGVFKCSRFLQGSTRGLDNASEGIKL